MSQVTDKLRKTIAERKESLATYILMGVMDPAKYHNLCGQHTALLRVESDIEEILNALKLDEEEED